MKRLPKTLQRDVDHFCWICVARLFAIMHNPTMRGPLFQWDNFPDMAARICKSQIALNVIYHAKHRDLVESEAERLGRWIAIDLLKEMTE